MGKRTLLILLASASWGCEELDLLPLPPGVPVNAPPPPAGLCAGGALTESGYRDLGFPAQAAIPWDSDLALTIVEGDVLVGTDDGLWRRPLTDSGRWSPSGLRGRHVRELLTVPGKDGLVFAASGDLDDPPGSFHRSMDGGRTWGTSGRFIQESPERVSIPMVHLARQPGAEAGGIGVLYGNVTANSLVRSADGGASWEYVSGSNDASAADCFLHVPAWNPDVLFQGCLTVVPMLGRRDISNRTGPPGDTESLMHDHPRFGRTWGFASTAERPGVVWVGMWRGLIRVEGDDLHTVFEYFDNDRIPDPPWADATAMNTIWIDPCDPDHIVFGGDAYGLNRIFGLYETFDDGEIIAALPSPLPDGEAAGIRESARAGPAGKDLVLLVRRGSIETGVFRHQVLVREHE